MSEKELPAGWIAVRLDEIAEVRLGRQRSPKNHSGTQMRPYLRAANVGWDGLKLDDVKEMNFTDDEVAVYRLEPGDIVLGEASGSAGEVGKPGIWNGGIEDCCFQNTLIRVRAPQVNPKFLYHFLWYEARRGAFVERARGVGIHHLGAAKFSAWSVSLPPLAEQGRIVEALEGHLSRLDVAADGVARSARRSEHLWSAVLNSVAQGAVGGVLATARSVAVSDIAEVSGGIQKQQKRKPMRNAYPFLRVANVGRGSLELGDIHKIELFDGELAKHRLSKGDLLVVEGNGSPDQIGRAAMWVGSIDDVVHQNHLIRVRPGSLLNPRYLELIWNAPVVTDQLREVARSTSGLYTLSTSKVKSVRIPVPSLVEQEQLVEAAETWETHIAAAKATLTIADQKGSSLRRAILNRAFTGALVPQDPADEPASVLLARIQAERAAQPKAKRTRRASTAPRKAKAPAVAPTESAPAPSPTAAPAHAVQQEFDL